MTTILAPSVAIENSGTVWTIDPCHVTCFVFLEAFAIFPSIFFIRGFLAKIFKSKITDLYS